MRTTPAAVLALALVVPAAHTSAQTVVSGRYYRHEVISPAGDISSFNFTAPGINNRGQIAFVARTTSFLNAVYVKDPFTAAPRKIAQQNTFSFLGLGGVDINDNQHVLALEQLNPAEPSGYRKQYLRDYDATSPCVSCPSTVIAGAIDPAYYDFTLIRSDLGGNINAGSTLALANGTSPLAAFSALSKSSTNVLASGRRTALHTTAMPINLRPAIADDGGVVLRAGDLATDPIRLFAADLASYVTIADSTHFTALGRSPGISDDGSVVVFYGALSPAGAGALGTNSGPGIFASIEITPGSRQIVRVAGRFAEDDRTAYGATHGDNDGVCDATELAAMSQCVDAELGFDDAGSPLAFAQFSADTKVLVTQFGATPSGPLGDTLVVAFIATPSGAASPFPLFTANQGLWTVRVDLKDNAGALLEKPTPPLPVVQIGEHLGTPTVSSFQIQEGLASVAYDDAGATRQQIRGDHQVALRAVLSNGRTVLVRSRHIDSDEDGLLDHWEETGIDFDQDGAVDFALNAAPYLAKWNHKDVFVEYDYMVVVGTNHTHIPWTKSLKTVEDAFAAASTVTNLDGVTGIALHVLSGADAIPEQTPLNFSIPVDDFDRIKLGQPPKLCGTGGGTGHFGTPNQRQSTNCLNILSSKHLVFHYCMFIHNQQTLSTGRAELFGNDFVVSLGLLPFTGGQGWLALAGRGICLPGEATWRCIRRVTESSTFMHELGHNLGLHHGGGDKSNCKPNYLSIMSYSLQFPWFDYQRPLDYSSTVLPTLHEAFPPGLSEPAGVGGPAGRSAVYGTGGQVRRAPANGPINWNGNTVSTDTGVVADVNYLSGVTDCSQSPGQVLAGFDDWTSLRLAFRNHASHFVNGLTLEETGEEWSIEEPRSVGDILDSDGDGVVDSMDNCPWDYDPSQADSDGDGYGDLCDPGDTAAPSVAITSPLDGAEYAGGSDITIEATASDPDGTIDAVRFFAGQALFAETATAPYTTTWAGVPPGLYALTAEATDNNNVSTASAVVNVLVHGTDISVGQAVAVAAGPTITYTITVSNSGPDAVVGAQVSDVFEAALTNVTWTCTPGPEASCAAPSGTGAIDVLLSLPANGTVTLLASGTHAGATYTNSVSVTPPVGVFDAWLPNNTSTVTGVATLPTISISNGSVEEGGQ